MLSRLTGQAAECYNRAADARERAHHTGSPSLAKEYLEMELRWLALAQSYELAERLSSFLEWSVRREKLWPPADD
jgi:hypothetical protein